MQKIKGITDHYNVIFQHVFRESNTEANFIANLVFSFAGNTHFDKFYELPAVGRRLINMDKFQILNLRVRMAKRKSTD